MGILSKWSLVLLLSTGALAPAAAPASDDEEAGRAARWKELQHAIFPDRSIADGADFISIDAPERALDAALVPIVLTLKEGRAITGIYLIIDNNPGPLAGHFTFGPAGDPHLLKLRVRVNAYTYVHVVVETAAGQLYSAARFVKAAGGCSAPAGGDDTQSVQDLGHIKVKLNEPFVPGKPLHAQLMIRHPNFNGMQMDQITRLITPAMFIRTIDVSYDGAQVMHLDSDISLSSDPVITFGFVPPGKGQLKVLVRDTKNATFGQSFDLPMEPSGYWTGDANAPVPATLQGATVIHAEALDALLRKAGTVVVDVSNAPARPADLAPGAPWMPLPHKAIPGALWLPGVGAGVVGAGLDEWYRSRLNSATAGNLDVPLVVYCHEACWLSWNAAKRAVAAGYRQVYWFADGIEGWSAAGKASVVAKPEMPPVNAG